MSSSISFKTETHSRPEQPFAAKHKWLMIYLGILVCLAISAITITQSIFFSIVEGEKVNWTHFFINGMILWIVWSLMSPVVFWLAQLFPLGSLGLFGLRGSLGHIGRENIWTNGLIHIVASIGLSMIRSSIYFVLMVLLLDKESDFPTYLYFLSGFPNGLLVYWLLLLLCYALDYYDRYRLGALHSSQLETQLANAQLQTLKMQLHPHFLFNTLNSISSLLERDKAAADKMIARLGDFLRLTLDERSGQEISLQRELEFLECYLAIERTRFQDKLKTRMRIGQGTLDAQIPSLVLLPVVENAIKHGICARTSQGRIEIISERQGDYLLLEVTDDGPGLKESGGQTEPAKFGLGLSNTQARLKQLYGDDGRLELRNNADSGLTVTILIPFKLPLIADSTQTVGITHDQFIADQSFNSRRRTIGTS